MKMKWYEVKERSAGEKRLILTYYIYKFFGRIPVVIIAFFVALATFLSAKDLRNCSKKYLAKVNIKPDNFNIFKHFFSYALSLVDKIEIFAGNFDKKNIIISENSKRFFDFSKENKGAVCIFSHVGNIDISRVLMNNNQKITIILSLEQAKIFRNFLKKFSSSKNINFLPVEEIGIETVIELKDNADDGQMVFIAGDRASKGSKNFDVDVLSAKAEFPVGTYKLAEILELPVFFVSCVKVNKKYIFDATEYISNNKSPKDMAAEFADYISKLSNQTPFQFFHFYDFFK